MKHSDDVIGRLTWNMSLCSRQPSYPGMVSTWKSKWWMFFRLWTVFLSSGLFVGPPPTGRSGRAAIQTGVLHTLERSNTAMSLQMQCRTVSLRTGRIVLAYLFHLSIILMHTISIHWCMTAVIANVIGQAGWKRLQMWSLSLNKSYIFHHHQQRQHFALTITYSRICASRTFISPQSFRILHPLFCILLHLSTRGARACAVWGGESGRSDSISQFPRSSTSTTTTFPRFTRLTTFQKQDISCSFLWPAPQNLQTYNIYKIRKLQNISSSNKIGPLSLFFPATT